MDCVNIEINSDVSYLGKDIHHWCMSNKGNVVAEELLLKYYSDDADFKPSDKVYYFVEHTSSTDSILSCGSLNMYGSRLRRDIQKSPRKKLN